MTTISDGLYQYGGVPVGGMFTPGRALFVRPGTGNDGNNGKSPKKALKTLAQALLMATANAGDVVYMIAESDTGANTTDYQSVPLDWNKDGVHLIGIGADSQIGQRSRIGNLSTAAPILGGLFILSANNCVIRNIEVIQEAAASNPTGASIAMLISGERNHVVNCQISGIADSTLDDATSRSLKVSGSENTIESCYIGLDTIIRATATAEVEISAGARNIFKNCFFNSYTSNASMLMISIAAAVDRFVLFDNCIFNSALNITSAVAMTALMDANVVNGVVLVRNPMLSGFTNITVADAAQVKVLGLNGLATGHLTGISQGVDVP